MTTATIDENNVSFPVRPSFPSDKRIVSSERNEALYVPSNQLPQELKITIGSDRVDLLCSYPISEETTAETLSGEIRALLGSHTKRIFQLTAMFAKNDFKAMLRRLNDINKAVEGLRAEADTKTLKKSYSLTQEVVSSLLDEIKKKESEVTAKFNE
jgi:hypothetical protein